MASPVRQPGNARSLAALFPRTSVLKYKAELPAVPPAGGLVLSVEFVPSRSITFWSGNEAQKFCTENVKWVKALLSTYVDSYLRVQTMYAHVPALPSLYEETSTAGADLMMGEIAAQEGNACVA